MLCRRPIKDRLKPFQSFKVKKIRRLEYYDMLINYRCIGGTWRRPAQDQEVQAEDEDEFEDTAFVGRVGYNLSIVSA